MHRSAYPVDIWCLCIASIVFGSMSIQCRDTEVHADCKPEVELESCPQEMFSFITVPSSRTLWHISHWMCCCCSFSFTVFILYHCCVLVLLELLLLLFMLLLSISINWSMYLYSIWYFICMLDCLASEWWWLSNWCGASRYGSVVSMGGCSLALTMILYLTEALYFRSSTLTFYVIFPCVLNCKFGYFFHFDCQHWFEIVIKKMSLFIIYSNHIDWPYLYSEEIAFVGSSYGSRWRKFAIVETDEWIQEASGTEKNAIKRMNVDRLRFTKPYLEVFGHQDKIIPPLSFIQLQFTIAHTYTWNRFINLNNCSSIDL